MPLTHYNYFPLLRKVLPQHEGVPYNCVILGEISDFHFQIELAFILLSTMHYSPEVAVIYLRLIRIIKVLFITYLITSNQIYTKHTIFSRSRCTEFRMTNMKAFFINSC